MKNHPIQSIEEMMDKNEAEAREILKNFNWKEYNEISSNHIVLGTNDTFKYQKS